MFFEIGAMQAEQVISIAKEHNIYAESVKDYALNDRVIIVYSK